MSNNIGYNSSPLVGGLKFKSIKSIIAEDFDRMYIRHLFVPQLSLATSHPSLCISIQSKGRPPQSIFLHLQDGRLQLSSPCALSERKQTVHLRVLPNTQLTPLAPAHSPRHSKHPCPITPNSHTPLTSPSSQSATVVSQPAALSSSATSTTEHSPPSQA